MLYQTKNSVGTFYYEYIRYVDFQFEAHMHRHLELIHVQQGTLLLSLNERTYEVSAGMYAWIPSNCIHAYVTQSESVVDVCIFSEDYVPLFARETRETKPETFLFSCRSSIDCFVREELFVEERIPDIYTLKSALYAITGELMRQIRFTPATGKSEILLDKIIQYVSEHYRESITLSRMADALGYEVHYLSRCFHSSIPMHFSRYVNLYRVDAALELLKHGDLTIEQIAAESGFQSVRSFNRVFLEITGKTPSQYYGGRYETSG